LNAAPPAAPAALTAEHLARLFDLARALAGACEPPEITTIAAERARALTGACRSQVSGLCEGRRLTGLSETAGGAPASCPKAPWPIPADAPEQDVVRGGGPIWIPSPREASEQYPDLVPDARTGGPDACAWALLPLFADDEVSGVLTLVFDEEQSFDGPARAFLTEVAAACGSALARGSLFSRVRDRADASEEARVACEVRQRRSERRVEHRTRLYERECFAHARAEAETVAALRGTHALVVQYDEIDVDGPVTRVLGVFSSERTARDALRRLDRARSLVLHASMTSWTLDVPRPRSQVEVDLPESPG
jgi:transcriptional regulator with GAF, ATPase, and Fis domain